MRSITLPAEPDSVRRARRFVAAEATGVVADLDAVLLMTSELVSNAIRCTNTEVTVQVTSGPPFRVEVHDRHAATDPFRSLIASSPQPVAAHATGGRGLGIVHALAAAIGLDDEAGGKAVWFEV